MKTKPIIIGIVLALLVGIGIVFAVQQTKMQTQIPIPQNGDESQIPQVPPEKTNEPDPQKDAPVPPIALNDCPGVTAVVGAILKANNIDLSRLNRIDPETASILGYASVPTGYTFKVTDHVTEKVFDGTLDRIVLQACYNNRLIITRDVRMSFINGVFRSAFDFDFPKITVSPQPMITLVDAKTIAYREQKTLSGVEPKLGYYDLHASQGQVAPEYILAWEFRQGAHVVIDAHSGRVVRSFDGIMY